MNCEDAFDIWRNGKEGGINSPLTCQINFSISWRGTLWHRLYEKGTLFQTMLTTVGDPGFVSSPGQDGAYRELQHRRRLVLSIPETRHFQPGASHWINFTAGPEKIFFQRWTDKKSVAGFLEGFGPCKRHFPSISTISSDILAVD